MSGHAGSSQDATAQGPALKGDALKGGDKAGYWPHPLKQFWWDMLPAKSKRVPARSGLRNPKWEPPAWLGSPGAVPAEAVEQARRAHEYEVERAHAAETKASRLAQTCLALLALALGLAAYQLGVARQEGGAWRYLAAAPAALAIPFLILAGLEALEIDRVGLYWPGAAEDILKGSDPLRSQLLVEERGAFLAGWTATKKLDMLLQARAWFSRGLIALLLGGLVAVLWQALM